MLVDVFKDIKSDKGESMLGSSTGNDFENQIAKKLKQYGFVQELAGDKCRDITLKEYLNQIKPAIQAKKGSTLLNNTLKQKGPQYTNFFIAQPYGSQDFPDFLIFTEDKIYSVESKFVKGEACKPVWNGNLPKMDGIYIFGSYVKQEVVFFRGEDILPESERVTLLEIWEETDKSLEEWMAKNRKEIIDGTVLSSYGFAPYVRKAYQQTKKNNSEAILDFFKNAEKEDLKDKVISWIDSN